MQRMRQLGLILAAVLSVFVIAAMPVAADQGNDSTSSGSSTSTDSTDSSTSTTSAEDTQSTSEASQTTVDGRMESLRTEAKDLLINERKDHVQLTAEARQKACEARAANINNQVNDKSAAAQRHLNTFTSILTEIQNFYTSKKLNVPSYSTLLGTALAKQAVAQTDVNALKTLDTNIDCTQADPAQTVATLKQAVDTARTDLQAYRAAITDIITALQGASSAQSTTGGQQ